MKKLAMALLAMFVGMSVMGCYKNCIISSSCGRHYSAYLNNKLTPEVLQIVHDVLVEEEWDCDPRVCYKRIYFDDNSSYYARIYFDWQTKNREIELKITTTFEYCALNGSYKQYDQFNTLINKIYKRLEEKERDIRRSR